MAKRTTTKQSAKKTPPVRAAGRTGVWRLVNRVQLAALMGVHPDTVTDYARDGMPVKTAGGRGRESVYDGVECLDWWRQQQGRNAKEAAQTRLYQANAQKAEQQLQETRGELVPIGEVTLAGQSFVKGWTAKFLSMPVRMHHAGVITRDQIGGVAAFCKEILSDISSWKSVADAMAVEDDHGR